LRELAEQSPCLAVRGGAQDRRAAEEDTKDEVIFETGYGPSACPHFGTAAKRGAHHMVRHAFAC